LEHLPLPNSLLSTSTPFTYVSKRDDYGSASSIIKDLTASKSSSKRESLATFIKTLPNQQNINLFDIESPKKYHL